MIKDAKGPFDAQQRLLSLGISQRDLTTIRNITAAERRANALGISEGYPVIPHFLGGNSGLFSGNYQERLETYPAPTITITTETPKPAGFLGRKTKITKESEIKEIKPVEDVAQEIANYARDLSDRGIHPVNVVDFGAGASITVAKASHILKDDILAGNVRVIATNIDTSPTEADIPKIRRHFNHENAAYLKEAITEKNVTFATADIVELYQMMQGDPVHLMFMVDMLPFTEEYNAALLQIVSEMVDPKYGTAVFSFNKTRRNYPRRAPRLPVIQAGLVGLQEKGFTFHHPLQVENGHVEAYRPLEEFEIEVYQANEAPPLRLYTT